MLGPRPALAILLLAGAGCGSHVEGDPGGVGGIAGVAGAPSKPTGSSFCPLFQERIDGVCRDVVVRDVDEQSVWFDSGGYELPGTLALPVTDGEYAPLGAVIVHGNGPGPRDGTASQNLGFAYPEPVHTYENLALVLARAGLAVLRYDKRSCFHETVHACKNSVYDYPGDKDAIVLDDFVADARAAARFVADHPRIRDQDVVALGHSEGGVLVTALFGEGSPVGSAVLLGAPALSFDDTATGQLENYADHLESLGDAYAAEVDALRVKATRWRKELAQIREGTYPEASWEGASLAYVRNTLSWYDSIDERFIALDRPVLALSGASDFNVGPSHAQHYQELAEAHSEIEAAVQELPDVTHAFCKKPDPDPWAAFDPSLAPEARQQLLEWLGAADSGELAF